MKCPYCGHQDDKVVDSRSTAEESAVRRRRECLLCGKRFTTYEYVEDVGIIVVKKDGRRESFDRKKILTGVMRACEKRSVSIEKMEEIITSIERSLQKRGEREVPSALIGQHVMDRLKQLDDVAYVRFASVYRQFKDVGQFMQELRTILDKEKVDACKRPGQKSASSRK
jgi:transcriptional repressor NrdR